MAAVLAPAGNTSSRETVLPTLYFTYAMNCTFQVETDGGNVVSSIPPGPYQVDVRTPVAFGTVALQVMGITDMTACKGFPQFQLTGPGVNISTTMTAGCSADLTFPETFQPNATYVAQDNNQPSVTRTVLTVLSSGSPQSVVGPTGPTKSRAESSSDLVGSGVKSTVLGTLSGALSADAKVTLTSKGRAVSKLKAGRYKFTINDRDAKGGFTIQAPKLGSTATLSGVKFVGKSTRTVTLEAGRWMYYTGLGKVSYFVVTA